MTGSANTIAARSLRAVVNLLGLIAKSFITLVIYIVLLILASGLIYILMKAIGLRDYAAHVLWLANSVFGVLIIRRKIHGKNAPNYGVGPGSDVGLRTKVKEELNRLRRKKPYPHA